MHKHSRHCIFGAVESPVFRTLGDSTPFQQVLIGKASVSDQNGEPRPISRPDVRPPTAAHPVAVRSEVITPAPPQSQQPTSSFPMADEIVPVVPENPQGATSWKTTLAFVGVAIGIVVNQLTTYGLPRNTGEWVSLIITCAGLIWGGMSARDNNVTSGGAKILPLAQYREVERRRGTVSGRAA